MICPHCNKVVEDGAAACPHCLTSFEGSGNGGDPVFCEGCGARISGGVRTCPKCGRPAPGILSTSSSSSDLAAGRTASFPRLTQQMIDLAAPSPRAFVPTAAQMLSDSFDPSSTNVLDASLLEAQVRREPRTDVDGDPYHRPRRALSRPLLFTLLLAVLLLGGAWFVIEDPAGVMPAAVSWFKNAASEMYPSRQVPDEGLEGEAPEQGGKPVVLTDSQVFELVSSAHAKIVGAFDSLEGIIEDYEYGFVASDIELRREKSASAYGTRDLLDAVTKELEGAVLPNDSIYAEDVEHMIQLAAWVRERVDMYCASWDISLSYKDGERPSAHMDEILAPLRERSTSDAQARDEYFSHVDAWKPVDTSS